MQVGGIPVTIKPDRTLRAKVTDSCGLTCTFCHNEGTPVTVDNRGRSSRTFLASGRSGRSSIYLGRNGVDFLAATMRADEDLRQALESMAAGLDLDELHLTGGEPTLHPTIADIVALGAAAGYRVCMTSNGENGERVMRACAKAGLDRVNLSIFGTTPEELAEVQEERFRDVRLAAKKIEALERTIDAALTHGVRVSANIVVPDRTHIPRVHRLFEAYSDQLSIRLLNSLGDGMESIRSINQVLDELGARPVAHHATAGASGYRTEYVLPNGRTAYFKKIRPTRLSKTCATCRFRDPATCEEGYYGLRLYRSTDGRYLTGVCIQRMDLCLPVEEFVSSALADEVRELRERELADPEAILNHLSVEFEQV
ncbi:radical SAM protein [Saccharothrix syringae]|uniref:Radical SAM protein n=1 Tax=Saccharothrix syringae TaxID=103733 RepID=A0A5Q0HCU8_SACSY|nr:radical SAM protein [Saccharothrix syringae]